MPSSIKLASLQLDAARAPVSDRLERAETLLAKAADQGAKLAVLPELFNTGYAYTAENCALAEPLEGPTHRWMRQIADRLHIYLAGAFLLRDTIDIYNSLLLISPNGKTWRYDKTFPWAWERAYFRAGHGPFVADTPLGRIGMLICWDVAQRHLWQAYAGKVDLMLISSCPPDVTNPLYTFPDGSRLTMKDISPFIAARLGAGSMVFDQMLAEQTAWLGVPAVNASGCGVITTPIPRPRDLLFSFLPFRPQLIKHLRQASDLRMTCSLINGTKILAADGQTLSELPPGSAEGFTIAEVSLPEQSAISTSAAPPSPLPSFVYMFSDQLIPIMMQSEYKRNKKCLNTNSLRS